MIKLPFWTEVYIRFRHHFYCLFRRNYVRKSVRRRKGNCKQCGLCCEVTFFGMPCPFLKDHKCSIYQRLHFSCKMYPFDKTDRYAGIIKELEETCGYYWDE